MGVVDFYASREAGSKERVSLFFSFFVLDYRITRVFLPLGHWYSEQTCILVLEMVLGMLVRP